MACLRQFDVERDIPGLSAAQKATLAAVFAVLTGMVGAL